MGWILCLLDRFFVLMGALVLSQAPLFMQQYMHQLSGHTAELHYQVHKLEVSAAESNKSLDVYIKKFLDNADPDFARQGSVMQGMVERLGSFSLSLTALQEASVFAKPFFFIAYFNAEVAETTWQTFEFGLSFSAEGLLCAFLGGVLGFLFFNALYSMVKGIFRLFANRRAPQIQ